MKGNKPICKKKNVVKKKKREKGKKYLGPQSNMQIQFSFMEWGNFVTEKNEGIPFSAEIEVVGSYTDRLLTF